MVKEARYITNEEMFELLFDHAKSRGVVCNTANRKELLEQMQRL